MSLLPMYKKCKKCKKEYPFNPSVGKGLSCPYCGYVPGIKDLLKKIKQGFPMKM